MFDGKAFGDAIVAQVRTFVDGALAPVLERLKALEERQSKAAGVAGALIDREGQLVLTLSDGATRSLGPVVGRDGADGKDGRDGEDGADGQSWDEMELEKTGPRTVAVSFARGDDRRTFELSFPVPIYRGVFNEAETESYEPGDMVTWGGSLWHFNGVDGTEQATAAAKPGDGSDAWTLAVKRGDKGRAGDPGADGKDGEPGRDGRDLTQMGLDGAKW